MATAFLGSFVGDIITYGTVDRDGMVFHTTLPDWWMEEYTEEGYAAHDHAFSHALYGDSLQPYLFGVAFDAERRDLTADQVRLVEAAATDVEIRTSLLFPLRSVTGTEQAGSFVVGGNLKRQEFLAGVDDCLPTLQIAALYTHWHIQTLKRQRAIDEIRLSPREREVLLWLSKGLRTDQIAYKLGIARVTVDLHFANGRRKLKAATREQALAKALALNLIQP
ncbi:helix-turn-helix transcriptional regulator [Roseospirillum parvum]|uniref:helix-turn-helix transcriptional regulator n=1 Tax=Roseospirillum parvum TaxID=83401 RepID=UPI001FE0AD1F|nr:LuxR family transcriptional regulator [Roseospirillum parvum]